MRLSGRFYDLSAAALAAVLSGLELGRLVVYGGATKGFLPGAAVVMGVMFCVVLVVAALGLALHWRIGWLFGVFGFVAALSYGSILRAGGNWIGVAYMLASFGLLASLIKDLATYTAGAATEV